MKSPAVKELDKQIKDAKAGLENLEAARALLAGPKKERKKRTPKAPKEPKAPKPPKPAKPEDGLSLVGIRHGLKGDKNASPAT
jgi:hypothetical protein